MRRYPTSFLLLTGQASVETAVAAMREVADVVIREVGG